MFVNLNCGEYRTMIESRRRPFALLTILFFGFIHAPTKCKWVRITLIASSYLRHTFDRNHIEIHLLLQSQRSVSTLAGMHCTRKESHENMRKSERCFFSILFTFLLKSEERVNGCAHLLSLLQAVSAESTLRRLGKHIDALRSTAFAVGASFHRHPRHCYVHTRKAFCTPTTISLYWILSADGIYHRFTTALRSYVTIRAHTLTCIAFLMVRIAMVLHL